ncbi:MAG: antibiotic biosynthesis monooxygenase [Actinomycetota bacterium]
MFFPVMLRASLRIRKQLIDAPGCLRFANILMGPRDFWTLTVWRTRQEMLDFMRSGEHEDIMWEFSSWLDSFWLMRWRPSDQEIGDWQGLRLGQRRSLPRPAPERTPEQRAALDAAFESLPRLRAAAAPSGAASLDYAPAQRRARAQVAGGVGGTIRVEVERSRHAPVLWTKLKRLHRELLQDDDVLRCAFGLARGREGFLLALFRDKGAWTAFEGSDRVQELRRRWPKGVWTMRWDADNEFGHWDGMRLRRAKLGTMVEVPDAARAAATPGAEPER